MDSTHLERNAHIYTYVLIMALFAIKLKLQAIFFYHLRAAFEAECAQSILDLSFVSLSYVCIFRRFNSKMSQY